MKMRERLVFMVLDGHRLESVTDFRYHGNNECCPFWVKLKRED